jgi:N-methylhydantoinase A
MRFSVDVGGTFTDLVLEGDDKRFRLYKTPTVPHDPVAGVLDVLEIAALDFRLSSSALLAGGELFIHGTTWATNAVLTGGTARTAFLTTEGHPDILLFREGGRTEPFDNTVPFPEPYVPRSLTFEVPERITSDGRIVKPLDESQLTEVVRRLRGKRVESVAVCLIWSIVNPVHELRVGEILAEALPNVPFTLSHQLNPALREYRRASSTCIDASLKPVMNAYLHSLESRLRRAGFHGRLLTVTSQGCVVDVADLAKAPIHAIKSGPSLAPVAGRHYAKAAAGFDTAIVADSGGTSYDVSLVRHGRIPYARDTWLGQPLRGHITGFPSIDVRSIGSGGGSIAWVDSGGMLHVGPTSAGSVPGPACYRRGGSQPTVTDAALVLGYLDPDYFLGGTIKLDLEAATAAVDRLVGRSLGLEVQGAALAILDLVSEQMAHAIEDVTINQGIDPASAVLIGGGGAAGLNAVAIARRLACPVVIIPPMGAALSATGAVMADLSTEYGATCFTTSDRFNFEAVNSTLATLEDLCRRFAEGPGLGLLQQQIEFSVEARYPHQVWEVTVPLRGNSFAGPDDLQQLVEDLHATHKDLFAVSDPHSPVEFVSWRARIECRLPREDASRLVAAGSGRSRSTFRSAYFRGAGTVDTPIRDLDAMTPGEMLAGPAVIESHFTTVVIDPGAVVERTVDGCLLITPRA